MQTAVVVTYKCNARCEMCYIWRYPSRTRDEIRPSRLASLPSNQRLIVISGGEPTLRRDLVDLVEVLYEKTARLQLISNGTFPGKLLALAKAYPRMSFRLSIDGIGERHNEIRGIKNGYNKCLEAIQGLKELGINDVGIAMTVSDKNADDLLPLYKQATELGVDFSQSAPHNSHYFHKHDNTIQDMTLWERRLLEFSRQLLLSSRASVRLRAKDWVRAYMTQGYLSHAQTGIRPLPCEGAAEFCTVDPFGNVLPCNGMNSEMPLGNLNEQTFEEIWNSKRADEVRDFVHSCENCWMVCNCAPSIRRHPLAVASWVLRNKVRASLGMELRP